MIIVHTAKGHIETRKCHITRDEKPQVSAPFMRFLHFLIFHRCNLKLLLQKQNLTLKVLEHTRHAGGCDWRIEIKIRM